MKILLAVFVILCSFMLDANTCHAQKYKPQALVNDSTPVEQLDFHLTKDEFLHFYGIDDTAKAVIEMFYRKRGQFGIDFCVIPGLSCLGGSALDVIGAGGVGLGVFGGGAGLAAGGAALAYLGSAVVVVGVVVVPVVYIVNRTEYSRRKLLYALVNRERGIPLSYEILQNLKSTDFVGSF